MKYQARMRELGFALGDTGGGCTAYMKEDPYGRSILITAEHDAMAPTYATELIAVSFWDKDGHEVGYFITRFSEILKGKIKITVGEG